MIPSKTFASEISSPPSVVEWVVFITLFLVTFIAFKFTAETVGLLAAICLAIAGLKKAKRIFCVWRVLMLLWVLALLAPVDIAIRSGERWTAAYLTVISTGHNGLQIDRARQNGLVENQDFVVYRRMSFPIPSKKAVVITVPTSKKVETPTQWYFGKFVSDS